MNGRQAIAAFVGNGILIAAAVILTLPVLVWMLDAVLGALSHFGEG